MDETVTVGDLADIIEVITGQAADMAALEAGAIEGIPSSLQRSTPYLTHPTFSAHHSEHAMLRYLKLLENKDYSLTHGMIPLGSCTMKLNATTEMIPVTWPELGAIHPFAPVGQTQGYAELLSELEAWLADITGYDAVSLQPNSGAQGEYAGLLTIRKYHESRGDAHRTICLIPASAHGTNPASAAMMGMTVVVVKTDADGNIDFADLTEKAEQHSENLGALMITYPSTHGVFEENVREVCELIHAARRAGVPRRSQHERSGRADQPRLHRLGRVAPQLAQDLCHSARRRRAGHGADWGQGAPDAVSAEPQHPAHVRELHRGRQRRAVWQRQHPADQRTCTSGCWGRRA